MSDALEVVQGIQDTITQIVDDPESGYTRERLSALIADTGRVHNECGATSITALIPYLVADGMSENDAILAVQLYAMVVHAIQSFPNSDGS